MRAMVFAAGLGTRLRPITDNTPKALVKVNGKPMLENVLRRLIRFGFEEIIINVHHFADQVCEFLENNKNFGIDISISDESDYLLDTGGGLKKARWFFDNKPFIVHNVDVITDLDLRKIYKFHISQDAIVTLAVRNRKTARYFLFDKENNLCGWKNFETNETKIARMPRSKLIPIAFSGIQAISPEIFDYMDRDGAFSITDVYLKLAADNKKIAAYNHDDTFWMDLGRPENIIEAEKIIHRMK
ncbi:MAG: nucleotidyltransferase family protein [Bacteroidota bacterium]